MMGVTHGTAGIAVAAACVLALRSGGADISAIEAGTLIAAGAVAAEIPDVDLGVSRISKGSSSLTGIPYVGALTVLLTLPIVVIGVIVRALGVRHRHETHSVAAGVAVAVLLVPLYAAYWPALGAVATFIGEQVVGAYAPGRSLPFGDWALSVEGAWRAMAPWLVPVLLLAYLSHLLLDAMTTAPIELLWPASSRMVKLPAPSVRVGSAGEAALALPLAAVSVWLVWLVAEPDVSRHLRAPTAEVRSEHPHAPGTSPAGRDDSNKGNA